MADLFIDYNFFVDGLSIYIDGNVMFAGGLSDLHDSDWQIDGDLNATEGVEFASNAFSGSSWSVGGSFSFEGSSGNLLNLEADEEWTLAVEGSAAASYVSVSNSDASGGSTILANDGTSDDESGNTNWLFADSIPEVDLISIEEALVTYFNGIDDLAGLTLYPLGLPQQRGKIQIDFPALSFNRVTSTHNLDLDGAVTISETLFNIHLWAKVPTQVFELSRLIYQHLHGFRGEWGTKRIKTCRVEGISDLPTERASDLEHNAYCHRVLAVRVWHLELV